jgi:glycosyltransferase involved in cell wall biosynthesis
LHADATLNNSVLMIAYHFPPYAGSSGLRRTLAFSRYLALYGWDPIVLTANARAYDAVSDAEVDQIPPEVEIVRAFALDAARHMSFRGRYPTSLALPDRWRTWQPFAVRAGLRIIRRRRPAVIWSTYPIASAHSIGMQLATRSGIPWVADMRDPMVEIDPYSGIAYPRDPRVREARLKIESEVVRRSARVVFCSTGALRICAERYGEQAARRFSIIPNGYDDRAFADAESTLGLSERPGQHFRLVHSGTVYPGDDRGPGPLFAALASLRSLGKLPPAFQLVLRGTGYDGEIAALAASAGVADLVELAGSLPYREALQEMLRADGLLLLQGAASNPAIPAKLYEYLRAQRPILALVHPEGDTAALLRELHGAVLAPLDNESAIATALVGFFDGCKRNAAPIVAREVAQRFSRLAQTADLAAILGEAALIRARNS